jgi:pimeloyl-ACP methyl ester carboxylesterase
MRSIAIFGDHPLAVTIAALRLLPEENHVFHFSDGGNSQAELDLSVCGPGRGRPLPSGATQRFHAITTSNRVQAENIWTPDFDEIWWIPQCETVTGGQIGTLAAQKMSCFLATVQTKPAGAAILVTAAPPDPTRASSAGQSTQEASVLKEIETDFLSRCLAAAIPSRIFRTATLVNHSAVLPGSDPHGLRSFVAALHQTVREVRVRSSRYFDFNALRVRGPARVELSVLPVAAAAESLVAIVDASTNFGSRCDIYNPSPIVMDELCEFLGSLYDISLIVVQSPDELNAVDRLFEARLAGFRWSLCPPPPTNLSTPAPITLVPVETVPTASELLRPCLEAMLHELERLAERDQQRQRDLPVQLTPKTITQAGSNLTYYSIGAGSQPLVILNALGQGLEYWYPLLTKLNGHRRIILWEPRGLDVSDHVFGVEDQVADILAILNHEGIGKCCLVGWCTGPKVALCFYRQYPRLVDSMLFLNSSFNCSQLPEELTTDYEKNLAVLCNSACRRPDSTPLIMRSLSANIAAEPETSGDDGNGAEMAESVLSSMDVRLRAWVVKPFSNELYALRYAHQVKNFLAYDARPDMPRVKVPVLLMASELDTISAPAVSTEVARLFTDARCIEVLAGTHHCLFDRPQLVAAVIEEFAATHDIRWAASQELRMVYRTDGASMSEVSHGGGAAELYSTR